MPLKAMFATVKENRDISVLDLFVHEGNVNLQIPNNLMSCPQSLRANYNSMIMVLRQRNIAAHMHWNCQSNLNSTVCKAGSKTKQIQKEKLPYYCHFQSFKGVQWEIKPTIFLPTISCKKFRFWDFGFQPKNNELSEKHSCPVEQLIFGSFSLWWCL